MNRDELRAAQQPLKARYREDPDAAVHAVSATAVFGEPVTVEVPTAAGIVRADCTRLRAATARTPARATC